MLSLRLF
jgi:cold-inducible RNA-binding protein